MVVLALTGVYMIGFSAGQQIQFSATKPNTSAAPSDLQLDSGTWREVKSYKGRSFVLEGGQEKRRIAINFDDFGQPEFVHWTISDFYDGSLLSEKHWLLRSDGAIRTEYLYAAPRIEEGETMKNEYVNNILVRRSIYTYDPKDSRDNPSRRRIDSKFDADKNETRVTRMPDGSVITERFDAYEQLKHRSVLRQGTSRTVQHRTP